MQAKTTLRRGFLFTFSKHDVGYHGNGNKFPARYVLAVINSDTLVGVSLP